MDRTSNEQELLALERRYWQAMQDRDVETAVRLTDFPCIVVGPQGLRTVDEPTYRRMMERPGYQIDKVEVSDDAQVRVLRDDVAVVAYRVHEELTVDGRPVVLDAADSSTWIRRGGQWRCAHHTETLPGDPFGR